MKDERHSWNSETNADEDRSLRPFCAPSSIAFHSSVYTERSFVFSNALYLDAAINYMNSKKRAARKAISAAPTTNRLTNQSAERSPMIKNARTKTRNRLRASCHFLTA